MSVTKMKTLAHTAKLGWPIASPGLIDKYKIRAKEEEHAKWAALPSQGKSVHAFKNDKIGNEWLFKPPLPQTL